MEKPDPSCHKALLSTPCHFIGEYNSDNLMISLAFPGMWGGKTNRLRLEPSPSFRTHLVISFRAEQPREEGRVRPLQDFSYIGDFVAICLSVLFGKRFDHHGLMEAHGIFCVPDYSTIGNVYEFQMPQYNSRPRIDLEIELNINHAEKVGRILNQDVDDRPLMTFYTAGGFYSRALRLFEEHPENAYLDLVTAGEILSNYYEYDKRELLDDDFLSIVDEIRGGLPDGEAKADGLLKHMYSVKKRYVRCLGDLIHSDFFSRSETMDPPPAGLAEDDKIAAIKASYDLRSRYVHTGEPFGGWIKRFHHRGDERIWGVSHIADKRLRKILEKSPTFIGLERMIRYALLRFAHLELCPIDDRLGDPEPCVGTGQT